MLMGIFTCTRIVCVCVYASVYIGKYRSFGVAGQQRRPLQGNVILLQDSTLMSLFDNFLAKISVLSAYVGVFSSISFFIQNATQLVFHHALALRQKKR